MPQNIIVTGCNGFIGKVLCKCLTSESRIIGIDREISGCQDSTFVSEKADIETSKEIETVFEKYLPEIVVHCAGVAHQKLGGVDSTRYFRVNSEATEALAKAAIRINSSVCFVFLSSVSIYGEDSSKECISEENECFPSSDYARSKLDAERRLIRLFDEGHLRHLIILRLAPVYDREWSFNLDRRVLTPKRIGYLRFGKGQQKMSALARPNLVEFIHFLLQRLSKDTGIEVMNVCDAHPYTFNEIIRVFRDSDSHPNCPIIAVPLSVVWILTRVGGLLFSTKRTWIHSCYEKVASSLVFDNRRMLETGYKPRHSLQTTFPSSTG